MSCLRPPDKWRRSWISRRRRRGNKEEEGPSSSAASGETCCSRSWRQSCRRAASATPPRLSPSMRRNTAASRSYTLLTAQLSEQRHSSDATGSTRWWPDGWGSPSPPTRADKGVDESGTTMKQHVLTKLRSSKVTTEAIGVVERSEMSNDAPVAPLRYRPPLSLLLAGIGKGNVCVAGDALHPMTPDLGQGGCSALEDGVVLARCLGDAILDAGKGSGTEKERIESGLGRYAGARRWRIIKLIGTAYIVGFMQQSNNAIISFLREKFLVGVLARRLVKMSDYDCGTL